MASTPATSDDHKVEADVGVLVVHGIGSQSKGSTLRDMADALITQVTEQMPQSTVDPVPGEVKVPTVRMTVDAPGGSQRWLVREAHWAEAFDTPTRTEVTQWLAGVAPWFVFFFVARLWRRFNVGRVQLVLGLAAAGLIVAAIVNARKTSSVVDNWTWALALGGIVWCIVAAFALPKGKVGPAVVAATVLVVYPLAALAAAGVLVLYVLGLLPGMDRVRKLQVALAGSVGDVYALVGNARRERAMFDVIVQAKENLVADMNSERQTKRVVVLAHSQGAALMYRLLKRQPDLMDGLRVTLVTYGSAIVPIQYFEERERRTNLFVRRVVPFFGLLSFAGLLLLLMWSAAGNPPWWPLYAADLAALLLLTYTAWQDGQRPAARDKGGAASALLRTNFRWVDLWSAWDPVPNGPLWLDRPRAIRKGTTGEYRSLVPTWSTTGTSVYPTSYMTSNAHQPWRDHVNYRSNREDAMSRVAMEIVAIGIDVPDEAITRVEHVSAPTPASQGGELENEVAEAGRKARQWRGIILFASQVALLMTSVVAIASRWSELPRLGLWLDEHAPDAVRTVIRKLVDVMPERARDVAAGPNRDPAVFQGVAVVLGGVVGLALLQSVVMRIAQSGASARFARPASTTTSRQVWAPVAFGLASFIVIVVALVPLFLSTQVETPAGSFTKVEITLDLAVTGNPNRLVPVTGTVTIQPVGKGKEAARVVEVKSGSVTVEIRTTHEVIVSASAPGGKDCTVDSSQTGKVIVVCVPVSQPFTPGSQP